MGACRPRKLYGLVREAVAAILPPATLRYIAFIRGLAGAVAGG